MGAAAPRHLSGRRPRLRPRHARILAAAGHRTSVPGDRSVIPGRASVIPMFRFALRLIKPYTTWLVIVMVAMLVETVMSLASPWPLKIVLDSVLDARAAPGWLVWLLGAEPGRLAVLKAAVIATVAIALAQGAGSYLNSYYSSNIGQWIGHDLRQRMYGHLQRLSMSYYD